MPLRPEVQSAFRRATASGLFVASCDGTDLAAVMATIAPGLGGGDWAQIVVFFSPEIDAAGLAARLSALLPHVPLCGCSTAGGITPFGFTETGLVVLGFPCAHFRVAAAVFESITTLEPEAIFRQGLETRAALLAAATGTGFDGQFGLLLIDGVSHREERIVAGIRAAAYDFAMLGGSAGDGLAFGRTSVMFGTRIVDNAAVVLLVATDLPFRAFRTQNFEMTPTKLVVTAADVERRIVHELNAEPAALEYAAAIGASPEALDPMRFALHPVAFQAGGDHYCRSIRNANADGSLTFYCAIEEGVVLTVARPIDLVESTRTALAAVERDLGSIDLILGFECVLRRLAAESRQTARVLEGLYRDYGLIGFHTYGEQFNAMHLNQTLTGIAIGPARVAP